MTNLSNPEKIAAAAMHRRNERDGSHRPYAANDKANHLAIFAHDRPAAHSLCASSVNEDDLTPIPELLQFAGCHTAPRLRKT